MEIFNLFGSQVRLRSTRIHMSVVDFVFYPASQRVVIIFLGWNSRFCKSCGNQYTWSFFYKGGLFLLLVLSVSAVYQVLICPGNSQHCGFDVGLFWAVINVSVLCQIAYVEKFQLQYPGFIVLTEDISTTVGIIT
ncbi:uncharacterized protein YALI1_C22878g [Yarrowia lipolytica]|uniref:Uncharacterized protein n=1 Tax=Yarrowia lipolytica TaxID=4952 RepID=A0A1D8NBC9_YARLL|nr:hypothetical protein YALI1_C22878g [Yarrowia lipolytica]